MSHLTCIAFDVTSRDDFQRLVGAALDRATTPAELGSLAERYLWFCDPSGAALGARLDPNEGVACITPFFVAPDGGTRWRARTRQPHVDRECLHCSGVDCDVLDANGEMCTRTALQLLFFEPYQRWLAQDRTFEMTVVGFASSLFLCTTAEDLERAQSALFGEAEPGVPPTPGKPLRLADQAFLPHGMFGADGNLGARARALLTGHVESVALPRNELTGTPFVHARVHTLGAPIDVVAPASAVDIPEHATLAMADCWLVARPVDAPPA